MMLSFWLDVPFLGSPYFIAPWVAGSALLMVSSIATYSWSSVRLRRNIRFEALALVVLLGAALVSAPWNTLSLLSAAYLISIPFSAYQYSRIRRRRAGDRSMPEPARTPSA